MQSKLSKEQSDKLISALKSELAANANDGQVPLFTRALAAAGVTGVIQPSTANASQYIRRAKGLEPRQKVSVLGDTPSTALNGLKPSEAIIAAENQIAKALRELETERTAKMNEVKDLDNLIAKYSRFTK